MKKILVGVIVAILATQLLVGFVNAKPRRRWDFRPRFNETDPETIRRWERYIGLQVTGRIIISTFNVILYGYLTYFYINLYRDNESKFSLGLASLSIVLLVYSITANPLVLQFFWRTNPIWISFFNFVPDIFATVAAIIMIYLSRT